MSFISSLLAIASQAAPKLSSRVLASSGYTLEPSKLGAEEAFSEWTDVTAERQNRAWLPLVAAAKAGRPRGDLTALRAALAGPMKDSTAILEVGCGGGYNADLIQWWFPRLDYTGVDLSGAMVDIAKQHYPEFHFQQASAYELPFADDAFDIVFDGAALIHMPDWQRAVEQYARKAGRFVVLHGVTVAETAPTTLFAKYAYGQPSLELLFNRADLLAECERNGLRLIETKPGLDYDLKSYLGIATVEETWALAVRER
jgi:SAM-dependent methyltransferase